MIAADTNVLVRLATQDDLKQCAIVTQLLEHHQVLVLRTVLLEAEWVLRARYQRTNKEIGSFFKWLLESQNIEVEDPETLAQAIELYSDGMDFADSLHLVGSKGLGFHTFDRELARRAKRAGIDVILLK